MLACGAGPMLRLSAVCNDDRSWAGAATKVKKRIEEIERGGDEDEKNRE